jgi:hypothetical protein
MMGPRAIQGEENLTKRSTNSAQRGSGAFQLAATVPRTLNAREGRCLRGGGQFHVIKEIAAPPLTKNGLGAKARPNLLSKLNACSRLAHRIGLPQVLKASHRRKAGAARPQKGDAPSKALKSQFNQGEARCSPRSSFKPRSLLAVPSLLRYRDLALGDLAQLPGTWQNADNLVGHGWNMIALPYKTPGRTLNPDAPDHQNSDFRLLQNQFNETLEFSIVEGVPNRGVSARR